jgi:hypothetical protein
MKRLLTAVIFTLLVSRAFAGTTTLSSTHAWIGPPNLVMCNFVNVSSKPLDVTVSVIDYSNIVLETFAFAGSLATPSQFGQGITFVPQYADFIRCVFTFSGPSKWVRAALETPDATVSTILGTLPAT